MRLDAVHVGHNSATQRFNAHKVTLMQSKLAQSRRFFCLLPIVQVKSIHAQLDNQSPCQYSGTPGDVSLSFHP